VFEKVIEAKVFIGSDVRIYRCWNKDQWADQLDHDCEFTTDMVKDHIMWYVEQEALDTHKKGCRVVVVEAERNMNTGTVSYPVGV